MRNGFEVGIHDLKHDGQTLSVSIGSSGKAPRESIAMLAEWGASASDRHLCCVSWIGCTSWVLQYDASTFDTDPFEPQPEGRHTIFPFWVPRPTDDSINHQQSSVNSSSKGYVELPYTLPQDFTLFLLLREKTTDIWRRKLDWIAEHGGMALIDTHPDYMALDGSSQKTEGIPDRTLQGAFGLYPLKVLRRVLACSP